MTTPAVRPSMILETVGGRRVMATILVVDDSDFMRIRCRQLLAGAGFQVLEASNGQEAVERYQQHRPDLVMMDITMPVLDGIAAVKEIRKLDPQAKIVMCSALGQQAMVIEAVKAGARDFIVKPFEPDRVVATVRKLLA